MRVAMYYNNRDVRLEDMPVPQIGPGELLLKVEASGICGSDVMEWYRAARAPVVLGHEVAGQVAEIGDGVETLSVKATGWWSLTTFPATSVTTASTAITPFATLCARPASTPAASPNTCGSRL